MRDFFGCYLLVSKSPQGKGKTYIGFTVNPRRRIRQHNGLITAGAWKTSKWRPWEMTLVLYGFPTKIQALQFEWAWQHPQKSVIVRPIAKALGSKKLVGVRGKVLLMLSMLHESPWRHFPLTLQYLRPEYAAMVKESVASAPAHVHVFTAPMEELPRALNDMDEEDNSGEEQEQGEEHGGNGTQRAGRGDDGEDGRDGAGAESSGGDAGSGGSSDGGESSDDEPIELPGPSQTQLQRNQPPTKRTAGPQAAAGSHAPAAAAAATTTAAAAAGAKQRCHICVLAIQRHILVCRTCGVTFHLDCLATRWSAAEASGSSGGGGGGQERDRFGGVPEQGHCPACGTLHGWMAMLQGMQTVGWGNKPRGRRGRAGKKAGKAAAAKLNADAAPLPPDATDSADGGKPVASTKGRKRAAKPKATAPTANNPPHAQLVLGGANQDHTDLQQVGEQPAAAKARKPRAAAPKEGVEAAVKPRRKAGAKAAAHAAVNDAIGLDAAAGSAGGATQHLGIATLEPLAGNMYLDGDSGGGGGAYGGAYGDAAPADLAKPAKEASKRVAKPRVPRGRGAAAAQTQAGAGAVPAAIGIAGGNGGAWATGGTAAGSSALGFEPAAGAAAALLPSPESPSKRACRAQPAPPPPLPPPQEHGPELQGGGDSVDVGPDAARDSREASPVPLWRRLQARTRPLAPAAEAARLPAPGAATAATTEVPTTSRVRVAWMPLVEDSSEGSEDGGVGEGFAGAGNHAGCGVASGMVVDEGDGGASPMVGATAGPGPTMLGHGPLLVASRVAQQEALPSLPQAPTPAQQQPQTCAAPHAQLQQPDLGPQDVIILGTTSEEEDQEEEEEEEQSASGSGTDQDMFASPSPAATALAGAAEQHGAGSNSQGPAPRVLHAIASTAASSPPLPAPDEEALHVASPSTRPAPMTSSPPASSSPMEESPLPVRLGRSAAAAGTPTAATTIAELDHNEDQLAAAATSTPPSHTSPPLQQQDRLAFGSPAWGHGPGPELQTDPQSSGSAEAGGSAGGGVTTLLAQLRCGGSTRCSLGDEVALQSPGAFAVHGGALEDAGSGELATGAAAAAAAAGVVGAALRSPAGLEEEGVREGGLGDMDVEEQGQGRVGPACASARGAAGGDARPQEPGASRHGHEAPAPAQAQPNTVGLEGGGGCGTGAHSSRRQQLQEVEVVDLCSPLPLSTRLARRVVDAAAALAAAASHARAAVPADAALAPGGRAQQAPSKRLRSPKPPGLLSRLGEKAEGAGDGAFTSDDGSGGPCVLDAGLIGTVAGFAQALAQSHAPGEGPSHTALPLQQRTAVEGPGPKADAGPSGWSVSPWPLRRRRDGPNLGLAHGGGEAQEEEEEVVAVKAGRAGFDSKAGAGHGTRELTAIGESAGRLGEQGGGDATGSDDDDVIIID